MNECVLGATLRNTSKLRPRTLKHCLHPALSTVVLQRSMMDYEDAVKALNSLQTNAELLKKYKQTGHRSQEEQAKNVVDTEKYLVRSGISLDNLDQLSVIHVAGTKGKGSTCAFCESILHHYGFKTGFFSSPHLVDVRERIRINGRPLSKQHFSSYFFEVYNKLHACKDDHKDMPAYFKFLTVLAFYTFLIEKVDVAIVEVGIGGEHDCTNILRKVKTVGITSLGIDHTNLLGTTISEIAWQKAGIMKPGCVAFTSYGQPDEALSVLWERACEKKCTMKIAPQLESYGWGSYNAELGVQSNIQQLNASLALQLANHWIEQHDLVQGNPRPTPHVTTIDSSLATPFPISLPMALGLKHCHWPGRTQTIEKEAMSFYLDGAHTMESMVVCVDWFLQTSAKKDGGRSVIKRKSALIFNSTGFRDSSQLLEHLFICKFHLIIFCPNTVSVTSTKPDLANYMVTEEAVSQRCLKHKEIWHNLLEQSRHKGDYFPGTPSEGSIKVVSSVEDAILSISRKPGEWDVLITGSLLLVGAALSVLDPHLERMYGCYMG